MSAVDTAPPAAVAKNVAQPVAASMNWNLTAANVANAANSNGAAKRIIDSSNASTVSDANSFRSSALRTQPSDISGSNKRVVLQKFKTRICKNWASGESNCPYGDKCMFAHGPQELRSEMTYYTNKNSKNFKYAGRKIVLPQFGTAPPPSPPPHTMAAFNRPFDAAAQAQQFKPAEAHGYSFPNGAAPPQPPPSHANGQSNGYPPHANAPINQAQRRYPPPPQQQQQQPQQQQQQQPNMYMDHNYPNYTSPPPPPPPQGYGTDMYGHPQPHTDYSHQHGGYGYPPHPMYYDMYNNSGYGYDQQQQPYMQQQPYPHYDQSQQMHHQSPQPPPAMQKHPQQPTQQQSMPPPSPPAQQPQPQQS